MDRIVVGSPNLTQPLLLYPGLGPAMLEQHRRSSPNSFIQRWKNFCNIKANMEKDEKQKSRNKQRKTKLDFGTLKSKLMQK
jgi:hypothetical protein